MLAFRFGIPVLKKKGFVLFCFVCLLFLWFLPFSLARWSVCVKSGLEKGRRKKRIETTKHKLNLETIPGERTAEEEEMPNGSTLIQAFGSLVYLVSAGLLGLGCLVLRQAAP